jgi:hypothetical protein
MLADDDLEGPRLIAEDNASRVSVAFDVQRSKA